MRQSMTRAVVLRWSAALSICASALLLPAIARADATTLLSSSANPARLGQTVTFPLSCRRQQRSAHGSIQFRDGATILDTVAVDMLGAGQALATSTATTCFVMSGHKIKCAGLSFLAFNVNEGTPVEIDGSDDTISVAIGWQHGCALTGSGGVKCWGENVQGKLGRGTAYFERELSGDVVGLTSSVIAIAASENSACALTRAGGVKCWGPDFVGDNGDAFRPAALPTDVPGLPGRVIAVAWAPAMLVP